jgi:hypothetical protein
VVQGLGRCGRTSWIMPLELTLAVFFLEVYTGFQSER